MLLLEVPHACDETVLAALSRNPTANLLLIALYCWSNRLQVDGGYGNHPS
jgi:hypothetical protein